MLRRVVGPILFAGLCFLIESPLSCAQDEARIWNEFVRLLRTGTFSRDQISPYRPELRDALWGFLDEMRAKAFWPEWERTAEVHRVGNQLYFLIPLTFDGERATYCFTFVTDDGSWFLRHLEAIILRLDRIPPLPTSEFPDLPEDQKAWIREEIRISKLVRLYLFLSAEKGKEFALEWIKDGAGYALAAKSWVPFLPPHKAFLLYACWEQSKLRGGDVTLVKLTDEEALVRMKPLYFQLYKRSAHLRQQIAFADYLALFESIWEDRASNGGWKVKIRYKGDECIFRFTR